LGKLKKKADPLPISDWTQIEQIGARFGEAKIEREHHP
jgi:hypothetical protein